MVVAVVGVVVVAVVSGGVVVVDAGEGVVTAIIRTRNRKSIIKTMNLNITLSIYEVFNIDLLGVPSMH